MGPAGSMMTNINNGGGAACSSSEGNRKAKPHVVAVPHVTQGHLIPFLEMSRILASQGLRVSFITTAWNVARLQPQLVSNFDIEVNLVSVSVPTGQSIDDYDTVSSDVVQTLLAGPLEEWLGRQINVAEKAPVCIISDIFTWPQAIGAKFGVPTLIFCTAGAFAMSVLHSCLTYAPHKKMEGDDEYFDVPNLCFDLKLCRSDLPATLRDPEMEAKADTLKKGIDTGLKAASGIILNTFYDLEAMGIHNIENLTERPVLSIGPLLLSHVFLADGIDRATGDDALRGKAADVSAAACLGFLDSQSPYSVVFVCFGSRANLNKEQIAALAWGLEASHQAFIWAIRRVEGLDLELPEGFQDRTKDRGVVIWGWAPQLVILSHPSVGCFFSHCGWNSTLESVSQGVPMIAWAITAEQPFNSKLLVEQLGMATKLSVDGDGVPERDDVKRAVIMVLREQKGKVMRMRAKELRTKAKMAVDKGGSSHTNLQSLVQYIRGLHLDLGSQQSTNSQMSSAIL